MSGERGERGGEGEVVRGGRRFVCLVVVFCSYQLAESVDGQLRRMEQDLKEIIEQMNSSNATEDEDNPVSLSLSLSLFLSPSLLLSFSSLMHHSTVYTHTQQMVKVVKILNAHADSLNWIDRNTGIILLYSPDHHTMPT